MSAAPCTPRRRIFWKVYTGGLLLVLTATVSALVAGTLLSEGDGVHGYAQVLLDYVAAEVATVVDTPEALQTKLERLHEAVGFDLGVYDAEGRLLAAAGDPPEPWRATASDGLGPGGGRVRLQSRLRFRRGIQGMAPVGDGGALLVLGRRQRHAPWPPLGALLAVLAGLALVSWPMARSLARPLERLTRAAHQLGRGDLAARSDLRGGDEIGVLARTFDDMAARIQELVSSERELLANVSHELRTPLARLRVALELMEDETDPEALRSRLGGIGADLRELDRLVEDVLAAARLGSTAADFTLRADRVDLRQLVAGVAAGFSQRHAEHRLRVEADAAPVIHADPGLLRRLLDNLLENAARYAEPGAGSVELHCRPEQGKICIEVRDRGPGVDAADLPRLFDPFFRADRSRARHTGGVGLGLALCRRVAELHGGGISAHLREGGGLVVRVTLGAEPPPVLAPASTLG